MVWNNTYGDKGQDMAYAVIKIKDGYIIAGDMGNNAGLVKTDLDGNQVWRRTYGGDGTDSARSVIAVSDGYIIAGSSSSYEGYGVYDVYLLKTDQYGYLVWYKTFSYTRSGHLTNAFGRAVVAADDGYVIVGDTNADINGGSDIYLIKTNLNGTMVWNKTIGGDSDDHGYAIIRVPDGYVIAGDTKSYGNSRTSGVDASDIYLVKTDLDGNPVWNKTFGGKYDEIANSLAAVDDGYVIAGSTKSHNNSRDYDVYLVKTGLNGNLTWEKHYGKADDDQGKSVVPTGDGYIVAGYTSSLGNFYQDIYIIKTDLNGNPVWNRTYGGTDMDEGNAVVQTDYGYAVAGYKCTFGIYTADFCLLKIETEARPTPTPMATAEPTQEPTAVPTVQAGTLGGMDVVILVVVTIGLIAVVGAVVVAIYLLPKK
jgi:hypothetical protein